MTGDERLVGDRLVTDELFVPTDPLRTLYARKIVAYQQMNFGPVDDSWRPAAEQRERDRLVQLEADLARHAVLLEQHPGDTIPRAFLLEHQPHDADDTARYLVCRGCPPVYDSYDADEPAQWPCGPWQLVNERTAT